MANWKAATAHLVTCLSSAVVTKHSPQHISCGKTLVQYMAGMDAQQITCPGEVCYHHGESDGISMMRHWCFYC